MVLHIPTLSRPPSFLRGNRKVNRNWKGAAKGITLSLRLCLVGERGGGCFEGKGVREERALIWNDLRARRVRVGERGRVGRGLVCGVAGGVVKSKRSRHTEPKSPSISATRTCCSSAAGFVVLVLEATRSRRSLHEGHRREGKGKKRRCWKYCVVVVFLFFEVLFYFVLGVLKQI